MATWADYLLARDTTAEQRELEKQAESAQRQQQRAGRGQAIGKLLGGYGLPILAGVLSGGALTAPMLALTAGGGSFLGQSLGRGAAGGLPETDYRGGKFYQDKRSTMTRDAKEYNKDVKTAQVMGSFQDAIMAALMPELFDEAGQWIGQKTGLSPQVDTAQGVSIFGNQPLEFLPFKR